MSNPIENYALVSDLETAGMIGTDGSVDWLCVPQFDSPACFAALLGDGSNGFWRIAPVGAQESSRREYRDNTLILDSWWETETGAVRVTDFMPARSNSPFMVRTVEGIAGCVTMRSELRPRFHQGRVVPWVRPAGACIVAVAGPDALWQSADAPVDFSESGGSTVAEFAVPAGRRLTLMLAWAPSHLTSPPFELCLPAETALKETEDFWREWTAQCRYEGPWSEAVVRSLITLKALTFAPTGSIIAAPTTSLPGCVGGERNWDYRFCWLRDSALALSCLLRSGYREEATAWLDWLLRTIAGEPADLQTVYGLEGQRRLPETEAPWLPGYEGARPVHFGNAAAGQLQLDVYGEVIDALYWSLRAGIPVQPHMWSLVTALMRYLQKHWRDPDRGLWEVRGPQRHFVHSKVMSWVAADRAVRMGALLGRNGSSAEWRAMRAAVREEVCREGWDAEQRSFVQSYGSSSLDASSLLIARLGFLPSDDERIRGTVAAMRGLEHQGFLRRYASNGSGVHGIDGMHGTEGAFVACSLWYAEALAGIGRLDEARDMFERVLGVRNDVGLLSEQWDPEAGRQLGNAPKGVSHIALVETAFALQRSGITPA
ncbi:glycoside hydrolase family 15 protein [Streptomyces sp. A0642]|uniref:glycoside hydrolase family 15 protein n=1 Tax=Streptomyces sp. A0642 TaxID=2563100 RepID=UPI0010A27EBC|nr:glycoside hydrolase family 15 protein [Streptomyces sp. A0642]THA77748.1 glycoside hydrolase family 15 protein [Streptomyces sp. A0642]